QKNVPAGQQGDQHSVDNFRLADDGLGNFSAYFRHFFGKKFRLLAAGLATLLPFRSHRTGHESILDLAGSPRLLRKIKQSPAPRNRVRFLRDSNSMLAIIGM